MKKSVAAIKAKHPYFHLITFRLDESISDFGFLNWRFSFANLHQNQMIAQAFGAHKIPTVVVINQHGEIITKDGFKHILEYGEGVI
jgi:hypothetical protein